MITRKTIDFVCEKCGCVFQIKQAAEEHEKHCKLTMVDAIEVQITEDKNDCLEIETFELGRVSSDKLYHPKTELQETSDYSDEYEKCWSVYVKAGEKDKALDLILEEANRYFNERKQCVKNFISNNKEKDVVSV